MVRIVYLFIFLILVIFGIVFAVLNAEPVNLNYYFGSKEVALSLILVFAMIVGAVLGVIASASMIISNQLEVKKLRKSVELAEKEVTNLRAIPIRDNH